MTMASDGYTRKGHSTAASGAETAQRAERQESSMHHTGEIEGP